MLNDLAGKFRKYPGGYFSPKRPFHYVICPEADYYACGGSLTVPMAHFHGAHTAMEGAVTVELARRLAELGVIGSIGLADQFVMTEFQANFFAPIAKPEDGSPCIFHWEAWCAPRQPEHSRRIIVQIRVGVKVMFRAVAHFVIYPSSTTFLVMKSRAVRADAQASSWKDTEQLIEAASFPEWSPGYVDGLVHPATGSDLGPLEGFHAAAFRTVAGDDCPEGQMDDMTLAQINYRLTRPVFGGMAFLRGSVTKKGGRLILTEVVAYVGGVEVCTSTAVLSNRLRPEKKPRRREE